MSDPAADDRSVSPPPTVEAHHPGGAPGAGSTYRIVTGTGLEWEAQIVTWDPPHHLETRTAMQGKVVGTTSLRLVAVPGGCRVEMAQPAAGGPGTWAVLDRVTAPLFRRSARRQTEAFERSVRDRLLGALRAQG